MGALIGSDTLGNFDYTKLSDEWYAERPVYDPAREQRLANMWPNPTHGNLNFDYAHCDATYQLFDAYGRLVITGAFRGSCAMELPHTLREGVYFMRLANGNTHRFVLMRD